MIMSAYTSIKLRHLITTIPALRRRLPGPRRHLSGTVVSRGRLQAPQSFRDNVRPSGPGRSLAGTDGTRDRHRGPGRRKESEDGEGSWQEAGHFRLSTLRIHSH